MCLDSIIGLSNLDTFYPMESIMKQISNGKVFANSLLGLTSIASLGGAIYFGMATAEAFAQSNILSGVMGTIATIFSAFVATFSAQILVEYNKTF